MVKFDFYRTVFVFSPHENVIYGNVENTTKAILEKNSFSGIGFTVKQDGTDLVIYTRPTFLNFATKDKAFVWHELNQLGEVRTQFQGRTKIKKEMKWIPVEQ